MLGCAVLCAPTPATYLQGVVLSVHSSEEVINISMSYSNFGERRGTFPPAGVLSPVKIGSLQRPVFASGCTPSLPGCRMPRCRVECTTRRRSRAS